MASGTGQVREDQFLGALLGMAIGDALGRPVRGLDAARATELLPTPLGYVPGETPDKADGEITDKTEVALCLVESLTTNEGRPDPDNMVARMGFLAAGPSREYMSAGTIQGIELAVDHDGQVPDAHQPPPELGVAVRGVPVGLLHSVGGFDPAALAEDARTVTRLSHAGTEQEALTVAVASAVAQAGRTRSLANVSVAGSGAAWDRLRTILEASSLAESFSGGLGEIVAHGGEADSAGAIAGGLLGTVFGASGIPQSLIDDLDARIYLTLAAPWFYRTAVRRAGTVIDLRQVP